MYAEVIIPLALPKNYTWSVPGELAARIAPGMRVEVELGKTKRYAGIVKKLQKERPAYPTKDILNLLDSEPLITPVHLQLWEWMAAYYMCSEGEVMASALPAHFKLSSETVIVWNEEYGDDFSDLENDEFLVAEALLIRKSLNIPEIQQLLDQPNAYPVVRKLIDKKCCFVWEQLKNPYTPRQESFVRLNPRYENEEELAELLNSWPRAPKQLELLLSYLQLLKTQGTVSRADLLQKSNASAAQLKGLVDKDILVVEKKQVDRISYPENAIRIDFELSPAQKETFESVKQQLGRHPVCLLHGITSSGKTQVYIRLIEEYLRDGQGVLYLLPEIALTSQVIRRLQKYFGGHIGIYHSKFSQNERIEIWNRVKKGELKIVLGARSALFLPFQNLKLIIVDEEHDPSYKQQDPAPRYHARDTAIYYSSLLNARVLLGSATPSVDSYYNAQQQKYGLAELQERYLGIMPPRMELIPMSGPGAKSSEKKIISNSLSEKINNSLQQNKQVILFQNRRGYSPYQICQVCGWIPHCEDCDVTLTFHKRTQKLHCHYCGRVYAPVHTCRACGSDRFTQRNFGTEKIEEQLEELFPQARIARMDIDSIRGKHAHDDMIRLFEQGRIDILVGTQMVAKGLDFENVQLVGVLDADGLLNFADFRVNERAFQLIEQVSGRAGRKGEQGQVAVQALNTSHPLFVFLREHDYKGFFEQEIDGRKRFGYPPFSRLILLTFKHRDKNLADASATRFAEMLRPRYGSHLVGPAEPVVNRVRNQFLAELLVKLPKDGRLIQECKQDILEKTAILHQEKKFRSVVVIPDVDPL